MSQPLSPGHSSTAPPSARHIPALDGLRGLAILMVLAYHLGGGRQSSHLAIRIVADSLRLGWAGVSLFFVLSGFLITGILWDSFARPGWWGRFFLRRSLRIFPLYYLSLLYGLLLALAVDRTALRAFPVYALYLQDFSWFDHLTGLVPQNWFVFSHFWSLAVEEQFYFLWPFVLYSLRNHRKLAMGLALGTAGVSLLFRLALLSAHASVLWPYHALPSRAGELLIGAWVALCLRGPQAERTRLFQLVPATLALSATALLALALYTRGSFETTEPAWLSFGLLVLPVFFAAMLVLCLRPGPVQRLFENPFLRWYGSISYGVYVFQAMFGPMFVRLVSHFGLDQHRELRDLVQSLVILAGSTLLALLSFHTVEAYFRSLKSRTGKVSSA